MPRKKADKQEQPFQRFLISRIVIISAFFLVILFFVTSRPVRQNEPSLLRPLSRQWMDYAQSIVKDDLTHPPEAARFYAFVSSVYADVIVATHDSNQASEVTRQIIDQIFPDRKEETDKTFRLFVGTDAVLLEARAQSILHAYKERELTDGARDLQWDQVIPQGQGKWVKTNKVPFSPMAGEWKRWIVPENFDFAVPPPPLYGSEEDLEEIAIVKKAASDRDEAWNKKIIFWQGIPGTESPSGIWQNVFFEQVKDAGFSDEQYSQDQKILAQTIADGFLECWKVKYIYWTARPSMRIPGLVTSMPDPAFPSYVSGHSTISAAAATVLGALVPEKKRYWMRMAEEARDSRLYAAIHFRIDNSNGFALGKKVGNVIIEQLQLVR